ncbi:hypothetical protein FWH13_03360 [Candidatus Saccharibacteria bacterium]|nr:hypothetical protein [Candidatus Saccharibacteria bacterium]
MKPANTKPTILIGIASYRDAELPNTINSCLEHAKNPQNLTFAIINQYDLEQGKLTEVKAPLKLTQFDYRLGRGVGYARRLMTDLWTDEDFALQIDAHTRFQQDWDLILLEEWRKCNDQRAILSTYPQPWEYRENGEIHHKPYKTPVIIGIKKRTDHIPVFISHLASADGQNPLPIIGASGGFQFGPGEMFAVPYVREVCFTGEEFIRAFQLYSHGFNFYSPRRLPLSHLYHRKDTRYWQDMPKNGEQELYTNLTKTSHTFIKDLLAGKLTYYHRYFGSTHSLQDYSKLLNFDLTPDLAQPTAPAKSTPVPPPAHMKHTFNSIFQDNSWGDKESISGPGSTRTATHKISRDIERVIRDYDIKSVLDLPCGDFNWMQAVNLGDAKYIGADVVDSLIKQNQKNHPDRDFRVLDLVHDPLPAADLVIVRDCLVHFPYDLIHLALDNIQKSGAKYLLTTTFPKHPTNRDIVLGAWRPLNLEVAPFSLKDAIETINEGCVEGAGAYADKSMALFKL